MAKQPSQPDEATTAKPVVQRVLDAFVEAVAAEEGYTEVAARLRATLAVKGGRNEASLKTALFGPDDA
jgi:hypothetical protein